MSIQGLGSIRQQTPAGWIEPFLRVCSGLGRGRVASPHVPHRSHSPSRAPPGAGPQLEALSLRSALPSARPAAMLHCTTHSEMRARPIQPATRSDSKRPGPVGPWPPPANIAANPDYVCGRAMGARHPCSRCQYPIRAGSQFRARRVSPPWHTGRQTHVSTPADIVSTPIAPAVSVAPSESVPPWLTGRQYPMSGPCPRLAPSDCSSARGPAPPASQPAGPGSRAIRVLACTRPFARPPRDAGVRPPSPPAGPAPGPRPPPRRQVRPEPSPTQARASATGGFEHWPTSRARGGGARWRRSEQFITQSPGCRQGAILAPIAAWHRMPGSGAVLALGRFGSSTRPQGRGERSPSLRD